MKFNPHKSSTGIDANLWAMLVYLITMVLGWIYGVNWFAWVFPLVIYLVEKESMFVRFHALQALALYVLDAIVQVVVAIVVAIIGVSSAVAVAVTPWAWFALGGAAVGVVVLNVIGVIVGVVVTVFTIIAMVKAWQYEDYKVPLASGLADKFAAIGKK